MKKMKSIKEQLAFTDLTEEEKQRRGILGRLYGPCADIINVTRNGRRYGDELWEKVFNENEIVKELLANGGIPGEAQHPTDRQEVDTEKIAIIMPEAPKKDDKGKLIAYFDILDTPSGRVVYQLAKYGFKLGISSRGSGELFTNSKGEEEVDPSQYDFSCFDIVIIPAVKEARLEMVESLEKKKGWKVALQEELNKANSKDKQLMEETLKELDINLEDENIEEVEFSKDELDEIENNIEEDEFKDTEPNSVERVRLVVNQYRLENDLPEATDEEIKEIHYLINALLPVSKEADKDIVDSNKELEAVDNGDEEILEQLQLILKENTDLTRKLKETQRQVAVGDTKVKELNEELSNQKFAVTRLSEKVSKIKELEKENNSLNESIKGYDGKISQLRETISKLTRENKSLSSKTVQLNEKFESDKDKEIKLLTESKVKMEEDLKGNIKLLKEQLAETKADNDLRLGNTKKKLEEVNKLVEAYKRTANETANRYIKTKAKMLGISESRIKNELSESFTLDDIDKVCENLSNYNVNISKLPFRLTEDSKIKVTKSQNEHLSQYVDDADDVDVDLLRLANLK